MLSIRFPVLLIGVSKILLLIMISLWVVLLMMGISVWVLLLVLVSTTSRRVLVVVPSGMSTFMMIPVRIHYRASVIG